MIKAIIDCHSHQAKKLLKEMQEFFQALDSCSTMVAKNYKVMIRVQLPPAGQKALKKEYHGVEVEVQKFSKSKHAEVIKTNFDFWAGTDEFKNLNSTITDFKNSDAGHKLHDEVEDYFKAIDNATHEIENGFEIDNDQLETIEDESKDVELEFKQLHKNGWGDKLGDAYKKAFQEEHMQNIGKELDDFAKSDEGKQMGRDIEDIGDVLKKNVKVTDLPNQH